MLTAGRLFVAAGLVLTSTALDADTFNVFNTGVNGAGVQLANGAVDSHFSLQYDPNPVGPPLTTLNAQTARNFPGTPTYWPSLRRGLSLQREGTADP